MNEILVSIISMTGLGVFFAAVLAAADKTMSVKEDKRIASIEEILPGLNCGACGYAGCRSFAEALIKDGAPVSGCPVGRDEVAGKIAGLLGLEKGEEVKSVALLHCNADCEQRKKYAEYRGIATCQAADKVFGGGLACRYGCLGYGDCAKACLFGAITMANGLPVIDSTKCTSCGTCAKVCPRALYSIERYIDDKIVAVACSSHDRGAAVRKVCGVGCIACRLCEKLSGGVFVVKDNLAKVDYTTARPDTPWDKTIEKCPTKVIVKIT